MKKRYEPGEPMFSNGKLEEDVKYGHPRVYQILEELAGLHSEKNHDYASGGDPLGNFKRRGAIYAMYPGLDLSDPAVIALVDAMKQLDAALWLLSNKHTAKIEGLGGRLRDIAVYAVLSVVLDEEKIPIPF